MKKTCNKCGNLKSLSDFYKHSIEKDGHTSVCRECIKSQVKSYTLSNLEKTNKEKKDWRAKNKDSMLSYRKRWISHNPQKRAAHNALNCQVALGKIKKEPCLVCGKKANAHHPDYSKQLEVVWLCSKHHKEEHDRIKSL